MKKPKNGSKVTNNNNEKQGDSKARMRLSGATLILLTLRQNDDKFMLDLGKKKHVTIDIFKGAFVHAHCSIQHQIKSRSTACQYS